MQQVKNNFTFEQLKPSLFYWAKYFQKRSRGKYDFWELVSSVWVMDEVQHVSDITFVFKKIRWNMISYMCSQEGKYKNNYNNKESKKHVFLKEKKSLENVLYNDGNKVFRIKDTIVDKRNYFDEMEVKDIWDCIFNNNILSNREKLILKLRFKDNFYLEEIGEYFNCTRMRISYLIIKILAKLKRFLKREGIVYVG